MNEDSLYNRLAKGILTDEEIDNLVDEIMNIPVEKNNNCLSSYGRINVDDLIDSIKELRKVPTYDELLRENQHLKEEFDRMFAIYHSRKLIKKFNDEYDEEDKMKNPNRDYACVCPDAEEVYKRYYKLKEQLQQKEDIINKARKYISKHTQHDENGYVVECLYVEEAKELLEILDNKGE